MWFLPFADAATQAPDLRAHDPILALGWFEVLLRLGAAVVAGATLGINRDMRNKPAGLRTHALVSLAAALATLITMTLEGGAASRAIQGLVAGIGFLAGAVIFRGQSHKEVHGLTTSASLLVSTVLGIGAGAGYWVTAAFALALTLTILILGGPVEKFFEWAIPGWMGNRRYRPAQPGDDKPDTGGDQI